MNIFIMTSTSNPPKKMSNEELYRRIAGTLQNLFGDKLLSASVFGSYAQGGVTKDSDLDILIVLDIMGEDILEYAVKARIALDIPVPVDVIVRTPTQIKRRIDLGDQFFRNIKENGLEICGSWQKSG